MTSWLNRADWQHLLTPDELAQLGAVLDAAYDYFDTSLPRHRREVFAHELHAAGIDRDTLIWACRKHRTTPPPKGHRLHPPLPAELIALVSPQLSIEEQSEEIASKIWAAISDYGMNRSDEAYEAIGPEGCEVVRLLGGWSKLCPIAYERDANSWLAQLRDKASSVLVKARNAEYRALLTEAQQKAKELKAPAKDSPAKAGLFKMGDIIKNLPAHLKDLDGQKEKS